MMNEVSLTTSIEDAIKILKKLSLYKGKGNTLLGKHSYEFRKVSRRNKHTEIFDYAVKNRDYEVVLFDDSLFQFTYQKDMIRFAFIQNPNMFATRQDFLGLIYSPEELLQMTDDELLDLETSITDEEFEQFLDEQELNLKAHIIRYDFAKIGYKPLVHSYSHIHIGLNEHLRIPCSKIITPLMFVLFCIKHTYYDHWEVAFNDAEFEKILDTGKKQCTILDIEKFCAKEKYELYLD